MVGVVGHGDGFHEAFGFVVNAARPHRIDIAPVALGLRVFEGVAIDFGGRGDEDAGVFGFGQSEEVVRTQSAYFEGLDGHFEVINRAGRRCEVEDVVQIVGDVNELADVVEVKLELLERKQVSDVVHVSGEEIVHSDDVIPFADEAVGQMGAEEAGDAGDENSFHNSSGLSGEVRGF